MKPCVVLVIIAIAVFAAAGCKPKEAPKPPAPPPLPPPSPTQIAAEIRDSLKPVNQAIANKDAPIDPAATQQVLDGLRNGRAKHQVTENGRQALNMVIGECHKMLDSAVQKEAWHAVMLGCDALDILEPNNIRSDRLREKAQIEINRPQVTIRGFLVDPATDEVIVSLEAYLPGTQKTEKVRAHVGEEFYGLRLESIVGLQRGIKLKYLSTNEVFEVMWRQ